MNDGEIISFRTAKHFEEKVDSHESHFLCTVAPYCVQREHASYIQNFALSLENIKRVSLLVAIGLIINGPGREKTCLRGFANNKGADQPAHPHRLISAFVIRLLESIIS